MLDILQEKEVIFFDVGYTLDHPASGDWMLTNKFYEVVGDRMKCVSKGELLKAQEYASDILGRDHLVIDLEKEYQQYSRFYKDISDCLSLGLSKEEINVIADDRVYNMSNYIAYPDIIDVLSELKKTHRLGVISDTWPSIVPQLKYIGVYDFFESFTFSCELGIFKPDERMYKDALNKMGCKGEDAVFIDDVVCNLDGAVKLGITPILIAANPESDVETRYYKINSLSKLLCN